jgi:predicted metal-dependent hydrolase
VLAIGDPGTNDDRLRALHIDRIAFPDLRAEPADTLRDRLRISHDTTLVEACAEPLSTLALHGLHEFNMHAYFECHETLETVWNAESGAVRDLYRVILQVGLAYYQIERANYYGALKMFLRTTQWFGGLPDQCRGIDVAQLRADAAAARTALEALGPERIAQFDRSLFKPVLYSAPHHESIG